MIFSRSSGKRSMYSGYQARCMSLMMVSASNYVLLTNLLNAFIELFTDCHDVNEFLCPSICCSLCCNKFMICLFLQSTYTFLVLSCCLCFVLIYFSVFGDII